MVNIFKIIIISFLIIIIPSCWSESISEEDKILLNYDEGIKFYNKKKYSKAKDSFRYVILHSMGSRLAFEAEFYLAESLYNLKEYEDALYAYDNYARSSQDLGLIELSRFRLCQCAYNLTINYRKDQTATDDAIDKIEIFLEDYPQSQYSLELLVLKSELKYKLAKKEYEAAILYIKLQEYKSALVYLSDILNNYTLVNMVVSSDFLVNEYNDLLRTLLDDTRIMILYSYILDGRNGMAEEFYKLQANNFYDIKSKNKAAQLVEYDQLGRLDTWKDIYFGISK